MQITEPLRLAVGSFERGEGYGCAMNLISWETGEEEITDFPACADKGLATMVQFVNDTYCDHLGEETYPVSDAWIAKVYGSQSIVVPAGPGVKVEHTAQTLCAECSGKIIDLAHRTVGTAGLMHASDLCLMVAGAMHSFLVKHPRWELANEEEWQESVEALGDLAEKLRSYKTGEDFPLELLSPRTQAVLDAGIGVMRMSEAFVQEQADALRAAMFSLVRSYLPTGEVPILNEDEMLTWANTVFDRFEFLTGTAAPKADPIKVEQAGEWMKAGERVDA